MLPQQRAAHAERQKLFAMKFHILENKNGLKMKVTNYGGIVSELHVPDRHGSFSDITLGLDSIESYVERNPPYFGALIGRFGNRIGGGRFTLDGKEYSGLVANDGPNHLHGGAKGFDKVEWEAKEESGSGYATLTLRYRSKDGEEGYPGNLDAKVVYTLNDLNEWVIEYEATTDKPTVYNPTQHAYFNLASHEAPSALDHELQINASHFTATDADGIPTGEVLSVEGTALDFRSPKKIGRDIDAQETAIQSRSGYDHNLVIDKRCDELALAAVAWEPTSGREMKVYTTEPGVQLYSANFLDGALKGKGGIAYQRRGAFCLETQHFPNSPNIGHFPSVVLRPGQVFRSKTIYAFGIR